ncbi:hypothetical protein C8J56DRAFT_1030654 [Mycena floridula]|nr:hypothetical protein C8J56DRAFT_1030654 [Mycena floridula]
MSVIVVGIAMKELSLCCWQWNMGARGKNDAHVHVLVLPTRSDCRYSRASTVIVFRRSRSDNLQVFLPNCIELRQKLSPNQDQGFLGATGKPYSGNKVIPSPTLYPLSNPVAVFPRFIARHNAQHLTNSLQPREKGETIDVSPSLIFIHHGHKNHSEAVRTLFARPLLALFNVDGIAGILCWSFGVMENDKGQQIVHRGGLGRRSTSQMVFVLFSHDRQFSERLVEFVNLGMTVLVSLFSDGHELVACLVGMMGRAEIEPQRKELKGV